MTRPLPPEKCRLCGHKHSYDTHPCGNVDPETGNYCFCSGKERRRAAPAPAATQEAGLTEEVREIIEETIMQFETDKLVPLLFAMGYRSAACPPEKIGDVLLAEETIRRLDHRIRRLRDFLAAKLAQRDAALAAEKGEE